MIDALVIRGFKRFRDQRFVFRPLTVLAGLNGAGKTSLIHGLVLMKEAAACSPGDPVRLNGPAGFELGTATEVTNWAAAGSIELEIQTGSDGVACWRLVPPHDDALYLVVDSRPENPPFPFSREARAFTYLCAERLGPRAVLGASALPDDALEIGPRGEYSAQLLEAIGGRLIPDPDRRHPDREPDDAALLKYEVEHWLSEIARVVEIQAERLPRSAVTVLRFRTPGGEWVAAPNMGFGVSYSLPVVLGGLSAKKGGLFVVENPEAHLHPAGQSRMGVFLAWLAGLGIQVVVETHSDHVLNGIRRAVGEYHMLAAGDAIVNFFDSDGEDAPKVSGLGLTSTGGMSDWPRGFFDQYQIDVSALGRIRRQR